MQILIDSCLALLASIGLWTICNMAIDRVFHWGKNTDHVISIQVIDDCLYFDQSIENILSLSHGHHVFLVDFNVY